MKKAALLVFAALLVVMFCVPAMAMEHQFGGFWRTRFYTQQNWSGQDSENPENGDDVTKVDTRTRLYYTAVFHENLRFLNRFEMNADWGDMEGGDLGADGDTFRVKWSYVDANIGPLYTNVGIQWMALGRSILFDTDYAGAVLGYRGDGIDIPFIWAKVYEGNQERDDGILDLDGTDNNALDVDLFALNPSFSGSSFTINPFVVYMYSDNARAYGATDGNDDGDLDTWGDDEVNLWWAGLNLDFSFNPASIWFTGIYSGGSTEDINGVETDYSGWVAALGGSVGFGMGDVHFEGFYASGDDDNTDSDEDAFVPTPGASYYWSEIMGLGTFDRNLTVGNAPGDQLSNVWAANLGATVNPTDKLSVTLDVWYAALVEVANNADDDLGVEVDLKLSYELVEGLNMDLIGAYLFAGDAINGGLVDDADPYEIGSQLSLSF